MLQTRKAPTPTYLTPIEFLKPASFADGANVPGLVESDPRVAVRNLMYLLFALNYISLLQLSRTRSNLTKDKLLSQTQLVRSHSDLSQAKLARTNSSLSRAHLAKTNSSLSQMKPRQTKSHLPQAELERTGSVLEELARTYSHLSPTQPRAQPQAQLSRANSDGTTERLRKVTRAPITDRPLIEGLSLPNHMCLLVTDETCAQLL
jgi:hypothetical protein